MPSWVPHPMSCVSWDLLTLVGGNINHSQVWVLRITLCVPFPVLHAFLTHMCADQFPWDLRGCSAALWSSSCSTRPCGTWSLWGHLACFPSLGDHCLVLPTFQCQTTIVSYILHTLLLFLFNMKVISVPVTPSWLEAKVLQWFNKYF